MANIVYHDVEINGEVHSIPIDYDIFVDKIDFEVLSKHISSVNSKNKFISVMDEFSDLYKLIIFNFFINLLTFAFVILFFIFK